MVQWNDLTVVQLFPMDRIYLLSSELVIKVFVGVCYHMKLMEMTSLQFHYQPK